ncbi:class I SAM-dependent methyltransferase [Bailinhaonella thermotolerans]|uniref:Methyltransferase domain-containing protein n=1 Tax=Bailinhaonella thermotolerans TaxID=1070861 RepID=A0A3A4A6G8_9ACTN|nr:class I SAM-dependent methyltransferase [Bailinhaonella thermotolerans]RJL22542.1 methyltransferase domain-containing protein [Bailinhaonella thermotolerans]
MSRIAKGAIPSPNIWRTPELYEVENRAVDPAGLLESAMAEIRPWTGANVLDIGCGTGYHLPRFAADAARVVGVEPHGGLAELAVRRCAGIPNVSVRTGTAQELPVPDASVDVAHARWAYFFGPGAEPGLAELDRVMRRGGAAFVIDIDATRGPYGRWFRRWLTSYDPEEVEEFWTRRGWRRKALTIRWEFERREDLEAVLRIEFTKASAEGFLAEVPGTGFDYAANLWWRTY